MSQLRVHVVGPATVAATSARTAARKRAQSFERSLESEQSNPAHLATLFLPGFALLWGKEGGADGNGAILTTGGNRSGRNGFAK